MIPMLNELPDKNDVDYNQCNSHTVRMGYQYSVEFENGKSVFFATRLEPTEK